MDLFRLYHTVKLHLILSPMKRANYLGKHHIFRHVGKNCMVMLRKLPLYPELISLGDNVWVASNVTFVTHDVIHYMLNYKLKKREYLENIGCIDIKDNVFIGANSTILPNVLIDSNTIIGANTLVNKDIHGGVYGGIPAKYICSLEEFMENRRKGIAVPVKRDKFGRLSTETIEACFKKINNNNNKKSVR